jgi:hypothetical protein
MKESKYQRMFKNYDLQTRSDQRFHYVDGEDAALLKELVDKSIPMKVNGMINDWACAKCDSDRGIIEDKPYCAVCGQKLDWE